MHAIKDKSGSKVRQTGRCVEVSVEGEGANGQTERQTDRTHAIKGPLAQEVRGGPGLVGLVTVDGGGGSPRSFQLQRSLES